MGEPEKVPEAIGRYAVVEKVGSGGMGVVYRAHDPQLHREVAIKLVRPEHMRGRGGEEHRARMLREARAMAQLQHPNVVRVYDVGEHGDGLFIAMEFVEGMDASRWLRVEEPPWQRIVAVFRAAGRGLAAAHAAGLVHRDFKPANVLVGDDQRVRVMDFGLARTAEDIRGTAPTDPDLGWSEAVTTDGVVVGTPSYMAPEQFTGLPADARSDEYAFCVSLWEAVFRELPFTGRKPRDIAAAKMRDELRTPPLGIEAPDALVHLMEKGLSSDPGARFGTMPDLLRDLRRVAEHVEPKPAPRVGPQWAFVVAAAFAGLAGWIALRPDGCEPDGTALALREAYAEAVHAGDAAAAHEVAGHLATHWKSTGCAALAREWSALAGG